MKDCEAPDCKNQFEPKRSTAKFCSGTCRKRAGRAKAAAQESVESDKRSGKAEHPLVRALRRELTKADRFDTVDGQLALQLARRLTSPDATGVLQLTNAMQAARDRALAQASSASEPDPTPTPDGPDEVDEARRRREAKAAQAAASN